MQACELGKSITVPRKPMACEDRGAPKILERVLSDLVDPMIHTSIGGLRYLLILLDSYSGYSLVRFVARKIEAGDAVIKMVRELEYLMNGSLRQLTSINCNSLKWMRSNGGRPYIANYFEEYVSRRGIVHEVATAY